MQDNLDPIINNESTPVVETPTSNANTPVAPVATPSASAVSSSSVFDSIFDNAKNRQLVDIPVKLVGCKPFEVSAQAIKLAAEQGRSFENVGERSLLTAVIERDGVSKTIALVVFNSVFQGGVIPPASKFNPIPAIITYDADPAKKYNEYYKVVNLDWNQEAVSDKLLSHTRRVMQRNIILPDSE
jgi:hypothetical protein